MTDTSHASAASYIFSQKSAALKQMRFAVTPFKEQLENF